MRVWDTPERPGETGLDDMGPPATPWAYGTDVVGGCGDNRGDPVCCLERTCAPRCLANVHTSPPEPRSPSACSSARTHRLPVTVPLV